jgi:hypothetical protein
MQPLEESSIDLFWIYLFENREEGLLLWKHGADLMLKNDSLMAF